MCWSRKCCQRGPTQKTFFFQSKMGREDWNTTISGPSPARQRNAIFMAFRWRANNGLLLVLVWSSFPWSNKKKSKKKKNQSWTASDKIFWIRTWYGLVNEPRHEISINVVYAPSEGSDHPAHTLSLIRAFASRLSILWVLSYWLNIIWNFYA